MTRPRASLVIGLSNRNRVRLSAYWAGLDEDDERWGFDLSCGNGNSDPVWSIYVETELSPWFVPLARRLEDRTERRARVRWSPEWRWPRHESAGQR